MNQENLLSRVNKGLDDIRPYLATDGGDLSLIKITSHNDTKPTILSILCNFEFFPVTLRAKLILANDFILE